MALIGTLRTKMTKWVVGFVAVAILSFILNDLFGNGPRSIFGGADNDVGEIAGDDISLEEFQSAVQERENNYILSFGRQPGERELTTLRQQAWDLLISRHAIVPQYEKVGIDVTSDEIWDMIQGKNIDENIKVSFKDSAGNFDRSQLLKYLQTIETMPLTAEGRVRWEMFRGDMGPGRARIKFENLIVKTNYVTDAEGEFTYHTDNDVAEIKYLYVPYGSVRDSVATVTDADISTYYKENKEKYKTEETKSINYVTFPLTPTAADTASIKEEMDRLTQEFKTSADDSTFAAANTDGNSPLTKYNVSNLPTYLANQKPQLVAGTVFGPILDGNNYTVYKLVRTGRDTTYQMRASHILIKWENTTDAGKKAAKDKARKILNDIKGGADFALKAREFGTDGTASVGGDLGWFVTGQMVKDFEKPIAAATRTGLLNDVVESEFGYHIVNVTGVKDNSNYTVAMIERSITPSQDTQNEAFRRADAFASTVSDLDEFKAVAAKENLSIYDANDLKASDRFVGNLGEAREIVTWLFRDAKVGKVSEVFSPDDNYVVAVVTSQTDKGYKPLDKVKNEISPLVINKAKARVIISNLKTEGTFEEIVQQSPYAGVAVVSSTSDLKMNTGNIPQVGFDPTAVGMAFSLESGKRSKPFAGENGVLIIEMVNKTVAPAVGDYTIFKNQALQNVNNRSALNIAEAIKQNAGIVDKRYKVY